MRKLKKQSRVQDTHVETRIQPSENRSSTVREPSENRQRTVVQSDCKKPTVREPYVKPSDMVSENRQRTVREPSEIHLLVGKRLKLLQFVFEQCKITGELETNPINNETLQNLLESNAGAVRDLIYRVKSEDFISCKTLKGGRVGLRKFSLSQSVFKELKEMPTVREPSENRSSTVREPYVKPSEKPSSSSSDVNYKPTTTSGIEPELIDSSPLKEFGFGINQVKQCLERNWGFDKHPIELQQSIFHIKVAIDKGILAVPKGPGLIMEQLKRGKYHASESIKLNKSSEYLDKVKSWWDNLPMEKKTKFQNENNFDRMKNNDDKWAKIVEFYAEEHSISSGELL